MLSGGRSPAFTIDFSAAEKGLLVIQDWADIVHEPIRYAIRQTAEDIRRDAALSISQSYPPKSSPGMPPAKRSGFLLRSLQIAIGREKRKKGERAYVTSGKLGQQTFKFAFYGFMLESGAPGHNLKPRPFLVPARNRYTNLFLERVRHAVDEAIKQSSS